jgi:adenosylcobinamide-phosphate synthase
MSSQTSPELAALTLDLLWGEPPAAMHPTVWMGQWIAAARSQRRGAAPVPALLEGALIVVAGAALSAGAAAVVGKAVEVIPRPLHTVLYGAALKPALSLRALLAAGAEVETALRAEDLSAARHLLSWHLVSRDTAELSAAEIAGAAIESLAENLSDGLVAPLLAFRTGGLPAAYAYRFLNTADAMLGYRTPDLEWYGKAAALADDAVNWVPSRAAALLIVLAGSLIGADGKDALRCALHDAASTASPNAGWPMAAMAGALDIRLTKRGAYVLNAMGREPGPDDLAHARRIVALAGMLAAMIAAA